MHCKPLLLVLQGLEASVCPGKAIILLHYNISQVSFCSIALCCSIITLLYCFMAQLLFCSSALWQICHSLLMRLGTIASLLHGSLAQLPLPLLQRASDKHCNRAGPGDAHALCPALMHPAGPCGSQPHRPQPECPGLLPLCEWHLRRLGARLKERAATGESWLKLLSMACWPSMPSAARL